MLKDEKTPDSEQENKNGEDGSLENHEDENEGEQDKEDEDKGEDKEEDDAKYRSKLNAQNRFLEKEGYKFENGKWIKPKSNSDKKDSEDSGNFSTKDFYALMNAKIHEDDVEEVQKAARLLGKSIPETLKDSTVQAIINKRVEERKTANATNTQRTRVGSKKVSGSELLKDLSEGKVPEKGSEAAEELFWARKGGKKK